MRGQVITRDHRFPGGAGTPLLSSLRGETPPASFEITGQRFLSIKSKRRRAISKLELISCLMPPQLALGTMFG